MSKVDKHGMPTLNERDTVSDMIILEKDIVSLRTERKWEFQNSQR